MLKWLWNKKEEKEEKDEKDNEKKQEKSLFQFLKSRELNAKNKMHVSYVAPYLIEMTNGLTEEQVKSIIQTSLLGEVPSQLKNAKVFSSEEEAEKHVLNIMHEFFKDCLTNGWKLDPKSDTFVKTKNKTDLGPNAFWIFAIVGDVQSVKDALTTEDENYTPIENKPPMRPIFYARNNGSETKLTPADVKDKDTFKP